MRPFAFDLTERVFMLSVGDHCALWVRAGAYRPVWAGDPCMCGVTNPWPPFLPTICLPCHLVALRTDESHTLPISFLRDSFGFGPGGQRKNAITRKPMLDSCVAGLAYP